MRVLVADDERDMAQALEAMLKRDRYSVDLVYDGRDALDYGLSQNYGLMVLDVMMPKLDGLQVVRALREQGVSTPVLLLTARGQVDDKIIGLDAGADDYLSKPFVPGEFLARVRALTRRSGNYTPHRLLFGDLILDTSTFELCSHGASVRLGNKEYQLMELLMRRRGCCVSTELIMDQVWGFESDSEVSVVWVNISNLRRKLESLGSDVRITASRGRGYMLEAGA